VSDGRSFAEGWRLPGVLLVDPTWSVFLLTAAALAVAVVAFQLFAIPELRLPGSTLLYARFLEACTPDAEQAGMMASRMLIAFGALGTAALYTAKIPMRNRPDGYQIAPVWRRRAFGFTLLLAAATGVVFLVPEEHRGDPLTCTTALRDQFKFWLGAFSIFCTACGCKLTVDGLRARR
jgi:hypothetical protein